MGVNIPCTIALRFSVARESDLFRELFDRPVLGSVTRAPWMLRGKYFAPWVASPEYLAEESGWVRALFWAARLGGMFVAVGFGGFLLSMVYIGTIGQS